MTVAEMLEVLKHAKPEAKVIIKAWEPNQMMDEFFLVGQMSIDAYPTERVVLDFGPAAPDLEK